MTDEMAIGHYFKRATMIEGEFGSVDHHLRRYETSVAGQGRLSTVPIRPPLMATIFTHPGRVATPASLKSASSRTRRTPALSRGEPRCGT